VREEGFTSLVSSFVHRLPPLDALDFVAALRERGLMWQANAALEIVAHNHVAALSRRDIAALLDGQPDERLLKELSLAPAASLVEKDRIWAAMAQPLHGSTSLPDAISHMMQMLELHHRMGGHDEALAAHILDVATLFY